MSQSVPTVNVYDIIKKQNGEGFARVLRDKVLLDLPHIERIVKYAGHSADDALALVKFLSAKKKFSEIKIEEQKSPIDLLNDAGYHAFEVHDLKEQNSIKHFFRTKEDLCTFNDDTRYINYHIIHAIKHEVWKNPDAIKPSDTPQRQDAYGTSVISIQISKSKEDKFISIKNRYNHTVEYPDSTFNNNPDEIIPGLSAALKKHFNTDWQMYTSYLPDGYILIGDRILKFNLEANNVYFGDGFYVSNRRITEIDKRQYILMDNFLWDNKNQTMTNLSGAEDCFDTIFNKVIAQYAATSGKGKAKITITGKYPNQTMLLDGNVIIQLENSRICTLNLPGVQVVGDNFLQFATELKTLTMPDLEKTGAFFLNYNKKLTELNLPNLKNAGASFLQNNKDLTELNLPNLCSAGGRFLYNNTGLKKLTLPNLTHARDSFCKNNTALTEIYMPKLRYVISTQPATAVDPDYTQLAALPRPKTALREGSYETLENSHIVDLLKQQAKEESFKDATKNITQQCLGEHIKSKGKEL